MSIHMKSGQDDVHTPGFEARRRPRAWDLSMSMSIAMEAEHVDAPAHEGCERRCPHARSRLLSLYAGWGPCLGPRSYGKNE